MAEWDEKGTDPGLKLVGELDALARECERLREENARLRARLAWIEELSSQRGKVVE